MSVYRTGRLRDAALLLGSICVLSAVLFFVMRAGLLLRTAGDGMAAPTQTQRPESSFSLREQMMSEQAQARVNGWLSMVQEETVTIESGRGKLAADCYEPVRGGDDAPWALLLHGIAGSDRNGVRDIACEMSLSGYRVLSPDLYAHGASEGECSSLGLREAQDVLACIEWILLEDPDAQIVIIAQAEGAAAALLAGCMDIPQGVMAIAADSPYSDVRTYAYQLLDQRMGSLLPFDRLLFQIGYRIRYGISLDQGNLIERIAENDLPLLLIHGTGDELIPAWQSEDIVMAAGEKAQLLFVEGAAHGQARFLDKETYYDTLFSFFEQALGK